MDYPIYLQDDVSQPLALLKRATGNKARIVLEGLSHDGSYKYTQQPWLYFMRDGGYLKCLGTNYAIPCVNGSLSKDKQTAIEQIYPGLFSVIPDDQTADTPNQAICVFQEIFICLEGKKFTDYYKTLMAFKWNTGLVSFPLFDLQRNIQVKDGKLFGQFYDNGQPCWLLLTDKVVSETIKYFRGHECKDSSIKQKMAEELLKLHPEQNVPKNPDYFQVETRYCRLSYDCSRNQAEVTRLNNFKVNIPPLSSELRNFLHALTDGDKKRLDDFAELLARLYRPESLSEYLWGIVGSSNDIHWFLRLLNNVLGIQRSASVVFEKLSDKNLIQFLCDRANGITYQINYPFGNSESFKAVNHSHIMRFITGETIGTLEDPYIINGNVTGKGVLMYAAFELDEDCMGRIPHKIIQLPDNCSTFQLDAYDKIWMQTCLLCHGLHLLDTHGTKSSNRTKNLGQALREFVTNFCELSTNAWTDRKQFYEQFKRYCDACVNMEGKIPGPSKFSAYVEKELCWKSTAIRSNKNRLAFDGVRLDVEKVNRSIQKEEASKASQVNEISSDDFDAYVDGFRSHLHIPGN